MRTISFLLVILLFLNNNSSYSQECGTTISSEYDPVFSKIPSELPKTKSPIVVNIAASIHILRRNGVAQIKYSDIYNELLAVNKLLYPTGHKLVSCGPNYIDDNNFNTIEKGDNSEDLHNKYNIPGTVNIYFVEDFADYCGFSTYPWFPPERHKIYIRNSCLLRGTFAHEIGHFFGLYHTHETTFGDEYVNGSNCLISGDKLCDTPADPELSENNVNTNCIYTGNNQDANFQAYDPDPRNLMSYARKDCREHFSGEQLTKMEFYMNESGLFEEDCGGVDVGLYLTYNANFNYGNSKEVNLVIINSNLQATTQTRIKIYIKNSDNSISELISFYVFLKPDEELNIVKRISLPNFFVGQNNSLVFQIDPEFKIPEVNKANNRQEILINNHFDVKTEAVFFPNPADQHITALFKHAVFSKPVIVEIYDHLGQLLKSEEGLDSGGAEYFYTLNIIDFPTGIYFARFRWPNNRIDILRFVKV